MKCYRPIGTIALVGQVRPLVCDLYRRHIKAINTGQGYTAVDRKLPVLEIDDLPSDSPIYVLAYDVDRKEILLTDGQQLKAGSLEAFERLLKETKSPIEWNMPLVTSRPNGTWGETVVKEACMTIAGHLVLRYRRLPEEAVKYYIEQLDNFLDKCISMGIRVWEKEKLAERLNAISANTKILEDYPVSIFDYEPLYDAMIDFYIRRRMFHNIIMSYDLQFFVPWGVSAEDTQYAIGLADNSNSSPTFCRVFDFYNKHWISVKSGVRTCDTVATNIMIVSNSEEINAVCETDEIEIRGEFERIDIVSCHLTNSIAINAFAGDKLNLSKVDMDNGAKVLVEAASNLKELRLPENRELTLAMLWCKTKPAVFVGNNQIPMEYRKMVNGTYTCTVKIGE